MHDVIDIPTDFARAYVFDMDGTIYLGEHLLPGARRMIEELRRREIPEVFVEQPDQGPGPVRRQAHELGSAHGHRGHLQYGRDDNALAGQQPP